MQASKKFFYSLAFALLAGNLNAESSGNSSLSFPSVPTMPSMPSMPAMPAISSPVSGSSFYTPGEQFQTKSNSKAKTESSTKTHDKAVSSLQPDNLIPEQLSSLTAQDLVSLAQGGDITTISSLFNGNLSSQTLNGSKNNQTELLNKVLQELEEIKKEQSKDISKAETGSKPSLLPPKIIRFTVGNRDIASSLTQVYFSDRENDGTFLLTADSRCIFNNKVVTETIYLLFKSSGTKDSHTLYDVSASLSQSADTETPLKLFTKEPVYNATRTGNFVTLHGIENNVNYDLLLDIGTSVPEN